MIVHQSSFVRGTDIRWKGGMLSKTVSLFYREGGELFGMSWEEEGRRQEGNNPAAALLLSASLLPEPHKMTSSRPLVCMFLHNQTV